MKIKQKRAMEGGTWWVIVGAVVAIAIGVIILFVVKGGLFAGQKNVDFLSSCLNQGGHCEIKGGCGSDETSFYRLGCPDEDGDGKVDETKEKGKDYCCIPKEKKTTD